MNALNILEYGDLTEMTYFVTGNNGEVYLIITLNHLISMPYIPLKLMVWVILWLLAYRDVPLV